ncbi:MAG: FecR domain-containing protein [Aquificae bacterium]|nr:FecR domain-containing protein [Aquificota bacterium]
MKFLIILLGLIVFAFSQEQVGEVVKKQGRVKVYHEGSLKGQFVAEVPHGLHLRDILKTDYASMAFVKLLGVNKLVLLEDSVLYIRGIDTVNFEEGRVLFEIKKRGEMRGLKVRVRSVIIGVKGTRFMVTVEGDRIGIFLKEGKLSVRNLVEDFIRYRKREEEEFEEFKREIEEDIRREREEFERFKEETEREFREFVREFELSSGQAVVIVGREVIDVEIPSRIEEEFRLLDMF